MADCTTTYMGLTLSSPIVVGSSGLTRDADGVKACADAGAGAVVLKSIFEEQIRGEYEGFETSMQDATYHPEAYEYFRADLASRFGARDYCRVIEKACTAADLPVIASINCYSNSAWAGYAGEIESAGARALELNVSFPPLAHLYGAPEDHGRALADIVQQVTSKVSIPVSVKLPPAGIYVAAMASSMVEAGARGLVLFNRFFVPEVDAEAVAVKQEVNYSAPGAHDLPRRYIALLSRRLSCDFAAATGIHSPSDVAAMLLVGARAVQVVSVVYQQGYKAVTMLREGLEKWMTKKSFATVDDAVGRLAAAPDDSETAFGRFQYIRTLTENVPDVE